MPRTGRPKAELVLTDDEREQLLRWTRWHTSALALALRSRIILACAEGMSSREVAERLSCNEATVGKWRRRFVVDRLDGLILQRHLWWDVSVAPVLAEPGLVLTSSPPGRPPPDVLGGALNGEHEFGEAS